MLTEEQVAAAVAQFATAKKITDEAEAMRLAARKIILDYYAQDPDAFRVDPLSEKGNTWLISRGPNTVAVTFPESTPVPAHVDNDRAWELRNLLLDLFGDSAEMYFDVQYTFSEERFMKDVSSMLDLEKKRAKLRAIEPFIVPEAPGKPQSPRVQDKTGAK